MNRGRRIASSTGVLPPGEEARIRRLIERYSRWKKRAKRHHVGPMVFSTNDRSTGHGVSNIRTCRDPRRLGFRN